MLLGGFTASSGWLGLGGLGNWASHSSALLGDCQPYLGEAQAPPAGWRSGYWLARCR